MFRKIAVGQSAFRASITLLHAHLCECSDVLTEMRQRSQKSVRKHLQGDSALNADGAIGTCTLENFRRSSVQSTNFHRPPEAVCGERHEHSIREGVVVAPINLDDRTSATIDLLSDLSEFHRLSFRKMHRLRCPHAHCRWVRWLESCSGPRRIPWIPLSHKQCILELEIKYTL